MNTREYLMQYRETVVRIHALNAQIIMLRGEAELLRTKDGHRIALDRAAANIVDSEEQLAAETQRMRQLQQELSRVILMLPDPDQRALLTLVYIEGLKLSAAARRMYYSYRQIKRLHSQAVNAVGRLLESGQFS